MCQSEEPRFKRKRITVEYEANSSVYPHSLSFYQNPPTQVVQFTEFEELAHTRLQLHHIIENIGIIGYEPYTKQWKISILKQLKKEKLDYYMKLLNMNVDLTEYDIQICNMDNIAHHALKLAFCRSEELKEWFLQREVELFYLKLMCMQKESFGKFLTFNNLRFHAIESHEKEKLLKQLLASTNQELLFSDTIENTNFYKVSYLFVLPLVKDRKVFLHKGFAYIPQYELRQYVADLFLTILSDLLVKEAKKPKKDIDTIFTLSIINTHEQISKQTYNINTAKYAGHVTYENVNHIAKQYFPLCMSHINNTFITKHHLKHEARLQYLFFLYGLGMSYEDIVQHWQHEFTKAIDEERFVKKYLYSIKYAFGQVGRKKLCTPYSCEKIISNNVGIGAVHGCPFKHWDVIELKNKLDDMGIDADDVNSILKAKINGNPQVACGYYLKCVGKCKADAADINVTHPNQYFEHCFESNENRMDVVVDKVDDLRIL